MRPFLTGIAVFTLLVAATILALYLATFDQCVPTPRMRWVHCMLKAKPDLAGGLLGASGTIFAAWIAWTAVQKQIRHQARQTSIVEMDYWQRRISQLEDEELHLEYAIGFGDRFEVSWNLEPPGADRDYRGLMMFIQSGANSMVLPSRLAIPKIASQIERIMFTVRTLANRPGAPHGAAVPQSDLAVATLTVADLRAMRAAAEPDLQQCLNDLATAKNNLAKMEGARL